MISKEETIFELSLVKAVVLDPDFNSRAVEAIDMAIESLKDDWIPVSKELPKESAFYEVTFELMEGLRLCQREFFDAEKQIWFIPYRVIAWRERHKPYKGE